MGVAPARWPAAVILRPAYRKPAPGVNGSGVTYTLTADVENLYLWGAARIGTGNALDNGLFGTGGNDTLIDLGGGTTVLLTGIDPDQLIFTGNAFGFAG